MARNEIQKEIDNIPGCVEELTQKIQQLEAENNIASTLTSSNSE
ncbi:hypothetical protein [Peribacillus sp. SI8-4]|nr:hypothetical protein [Peribacillus sp. SI8-4]